jgi:hypothetical protein
VPEILNLLAPLLLGSINRENLTKRVRRRTTLTVANKKKKTGPKGWCSKLGPLLRFIEIVMRCLCFPC